jgi:hypothetical protein
VSGPGGPGKEERKEAATLLLYPKFEPGKGQTPNWKEKGTFSFSELPRGIGDDGLA